MSPTRYCVALASHCMPLGAVREDRGPGRYVVEESLSVGACWSLGPAAHSSAGLRGVCFTLHGFCVSVVPKRALLPGAHDDFVRQGWYLCLADCSDDVDVIGTSWEQLVVVMDEGDTQLKELLRIGACCWLPSCEAQHGAAWHRPDVGFSCVGVIPDCDLLVWHTSLLA